MKHTVLIGALALSIAAGTTLSAGTEDRKGGPRHHINFDEVDANKDGKLTQTELALHVEARFNTVDSNQDGRLSEAELRTSMEGKASKRIERRISHMMGRHDANEDGHLSLTEMKPRHMARMMDRGDTDGDGAISRDEFEQMKKKHGKRHYHKDKS